MTGCVGLISFVFISFLYFLVLFCLLLVLGIEHSVLHMLVKHFITELNPQASCKDYFNTYILMFLTKYNQNEEFFLKDS